MVVLITQAEQAPPRRTRKLHTGLINQIERAKIWISSHSSLELYTTKSKWTYPKLSSENNNNLQNIELYTEDGGRLMWSWRISPWPQRTGIEAAHRCWSVGARARVNFAVFDGHERIRKREGPRHRGSCGRGFISAGSPRAAPAPRCIRLGERRGRDRRSASRTVRERGRRWRIGESRKI